MITFSMIVPIYKGQIYINRIYRTFKENKEIFQEKYPDSKFELILVNDCPGETIEIGALSDEVILFNNKKNLGIHRSKIEGLKAAKGELFLFLDQDDLISSDYFLVQFEKLKNHDAVICNAMWGDGLLFQGDTSRSTNLEIYMNGENGIISLGQMLIRKDAFPEEWMDYPLEINGADDYYLMLLMLLNKADIVAHEENLYFHVNTGENLSSDLELLSNSVIASWKNLLAEDLVSYEQYNFVLHNQEKLVEESQKTDRKLITKEQKMAFLMDSWMSDLELNVPISSYIQSFGAKKIAIYGGGHLGKRFFYWIDKTEIQIKYFIDNNVKGNIYSKEIIDLDELSGRIDEVELIVVTPIVETELIIKNLREKFRIPVLSLTEVIFNAPCCKLKRIEDRHAR